MVESELVIQTKRGGEAVKSNKGYAGGHEAQESPEYSAGLINSPRTVELGCQT